MNLQTTWATALPYLSKPSSQTGFPPTMIFPSHSFFPPTSFIFEPCSGKTEINVWYNPVSTCFLDAQCTILPFTEVHFPDTQASFLLQSLSLVQSCWFLHFPASQISPWGQSEFLAQGWSCTWGLTVCSGHGSPGSDGPASFTAVHLYWTLSPNERSLSL